jgi:intraflagellar transport protein 88
MDPLALEQRSHDSPEHAAKDMEREVNKKIEASAFAAAAKNFPLALDEAKAAAKLERALCKHREEHKLRDQINYDLTYSVCFNLANAFASSKLYMEALSTYALVVKNK